MTVNKTSVNASGTNGVLEGNIENYMTKPEFKFTLNGKIAPSTILQMVPKQNRNLVKYQGQMPFDADISGDLYTIKIAGEVKSSPQNYISVVDINTIKGLQNNLKYDVTLKGNDVNLNDFSINSNNGKIATIKGKIGSINLSNPTLNGISVSIPQKIGVTIAPLDNLKLSTVASVNVNGNINNPVVTGNVAVTELNYPTFGLLINDLKINFKKEK